MTAAIRPHGRPIDVDLRPLDLTSEGTAIAEMLSTKPF
jgi:hypothetical protein